MIFWLLMGCLSYCKARPQLIHGTEKVKKRGKRLGQHCRQTWTPGWRWCWPCPANNLDCDSGKKLICFSNWHNGRVSHNCKIFAKFIEKVLTILNVIEYFHSLNHNDMGWVALFMSNNFASTLFESHTAHTLEYYSCVLLQCDSEDLPSLYLDNHTDFKDTWYLHV